MSSFTSSEFPAKLRYVGFCGIDDTVEPEFMSILSNLYPWIEWGVLFRSDLEGTARYASWSYVERVTAYQRASNGKLRLAAHLCFNRCQEVLEGNSSFISKIHEMGFGRVQVNITKANGVVVDSNRLGEYVDNIRKVMSDVPTVEFIFQLNHETQPIWDLLIGSPSNFPKNVSVLYDASCGLGVQISSFPSPKQYGNVPCGYAGGIGPTTIRSILQSVDNTVSLSDINETKPVWVDMESSLRTITVLKSGETKDIFDINKCMICINIAVEAGLPN
jgi:hypothetical protein